MGSARRTIESLYDVLAERAPAAASRGETLITATKETIDRDQEDLGDDDIIYTLAAATPPHHR